MTTKHCPYCGTSVPEDEYVAHLRRSHDDELTGLDRRLVGESDRSVSRRHLGRLAVVALVVLFGLGYLAIFALAPAASTAAQQPNPDAPVHVHGTIAVEYDGESVEFDDEQYLERDGCFHFHDDGAEEWHVHCEDVSIEYALETLGMEVTDDALVVDGEPVAEGDPIVTVDGESVDPTTYVLEDGDDVRIVAE